jgi:purine-nucleoside phosphorylase
MNSQATEALVQDALASVQTAFGTSAPDVAIILGSGLGEFASKLESSKSLPYAKIPSFPIPTVPGHAGECALGKIENRTALIFRGRFHYYEGHPLSINTLPVRVAATWGIKTLIVTNASGAIRKDLRPGGLLLISDHINMMGVNPLLGPNVDAFGPRFVDMTMAYDGEYRDHAKMLAKKLRIPLPEGVYLASPGPSYETPAEIKMFAAMGADVVGMSTVPEVIVARHHGMRVMGISCMTNFAAGTRGLASEPITHEEVLENTKAAAADFEALLSNWIATYEA